MTLKILHTSDWHLGQHFYGKSRAQEHQSFLNWLLAQVKLHQVNAVIVAGDVFDTGTPPSYAREMYYDFIVNMHLLNCQLIVLAGNHDSASMLAESRGMASHLSCDVVSSVKQDLSDQLVSICCEKGELLGVVCAVPFIRPRDIQQSQFGQSASDKQYSLREQIATHYSQIYGCAVEHTKNKKVPIIATGHLTAIGAKMTESVRDIYIGTLDAVPASDFPPADYIALGHIHRPQVVAKSDHIRYCGSPIPLSFDESTTQKQVNLVTFEKGKIAAISPLLIPCFQPLVTIKTSLAELVNDVEHQLVEQSANISDGQLLWLDIEVSSADYLNDLGQKIEQLIESYPVEVLRIRKAKADKPNHKVFEEKLTLDELSATEVFESRLDFAEVDCVEQAERLRVLYRQTLEQLNTPSELEDLSAIGAVTE